MSDETMTSENEPISSRDLEGDAILAPTPKPGRAAISPRNLVIALVAVLVLVVVIGLVAYSVLSTQGSVSAIQSVSSGPGVSTSTSSATATSTATSTLVPAAVVENRDVFTPRDPFQPLKGATVKTTTSSTSSSYSSSSSSTSSTSTASGTTNTDNTLKLKDIVTESGTRKAVVRWRNADYTVAAGETVGTSDYKVLSVGTSTVAMLYGDERITLSLGN